ncbi:tRNA lysidine(34) synthetase TilS [[Erwinia] mediterraneensis]|uniref:tRNA lysidine(34) synthetase TilS n=1 Tax=[Erwinia] mediterraneensis TaxID=2161819 RepID=UPI00102F8817|nr:tRNA lysidine(34) synthetase TilS [[Erwinia] mediterraneensis]
MLLTHLESLLAPDASLVVAFSGGLDSTVLLHQLTIWQQQHPAASVRALHVHHGLSPHADVWARHCKTICQQWHIPCKVLHVQVDGREKGIEAAARQARYQALSAQLRPGDTLLTAQHLDDQCETLLLALKRGSGPAGLAAMPQQMMLDNHPLLRPLLGCSRQQLEAWAATYQLRWVDDESNQDTRYDRNFLRQTLLPPLLARWPHFASAAARSAALCGEQEQLLDELLAEQLASLMQPDGSLAITSLLSMSEARRNALIRRWIAQQGGNMPSRATLSRLWQEVMLSRADAQPRLQLGQHEIRRYRQQLYWLRCWSSLRAQVLSWPDLARPLALPQDLGWLQAQPTAAGGLRWPCADEQVSVRFQAQGYYHLVGRAGGREMKKIWQEKGIAPWLRERIPLIYFNQTLMGAPGLFITREGDAGSEPGWLADWQHNRIAEQ